MEPATLPDFIGARTRVLSIGINPSLPAVRAGYPFANPRNRFWAALNRSRLIGVELEPGVEATQRLCEEFGFGFTDIVKRATAGMRELRAADYAAGAPILAQKVRAARPRLLWFHGMVSMRAWLKLLGPEAPRPAWGEQPDLIDGQRCFVSPNPSPANARFTLDDIVASYDALTDCLAALERDGNGQAIN